jgi:hypothetical protein
LWWDADDVEPDTTGSAADDDDDIDTDVDVDDANEFVLPLLLIWLMRVPVSIRDRFGGRFAAATADDDAPPPLTDAAAAVVVAAIAVVVVVAVVVAVACGGNKCVKAPLPSNKRKQCPLRVCNVRFRLSSHVDRGSRNL